MSRLPPLPEANTQSLAISGYPVEYIDGYEHGHESACDQLRERDRQIVELCLAAVRAERLEDPSKSADDIAYDMAVDDCAAAIRSLLEKA